MVSRWHRYAEAVIEVGYLAALIIAPLCFVPQATRVFELGTVTLIRTLALVMLAAWLVVFTESTAGHIRALHIAVTHPIRTLRQSRYRLVQLSYGNPLLLPVSFFAALYALSTLTSVSPSTSFFGSYDRAQGLATTLAYLLIFVLTARTMRSHEQIARAISVVLVVSFPVAFYGVIQHYALDPLFWPHGDVPGRITATLGNAAFLGAYLILILPLTCMRLVLHTRQMVDSLPSSRMRAFVVPAVVVSCVGLVALWGLSFDLGVKPQLGSDVTQTLTSRMLDVTQTYLTLILIVSAIGVLGWGLAGWLLVRQSGQGLLLGVYSVLFAVQGAALWFTQSRGPFIGLGGTLMTVVLLYLLRHGARRIAQYTFAVLLLLSIILVLVSSTSFAARLPIRDAYTKRLVETFRITGGTTGQVRAVIWQGAWQLVWPHAPLWSPTTGDDPWNAFRPLIGYGPETFYAVYSQVYPPELAHLEVRTARPDRAHNQTLDTLVQLGLFGLAAELFLFGSLWYWACRWLGLLTDAREHRMVVVLGGIGSVLLSVITGLALGWHFLGVTIPIGMLIGWLLHLLVFTPRLGSGAQRDATRSPTRLAHETLVTVLLAILVGHWLEIQIGIAVTATRTYVWVFAAMLIAIGVRRLPEAQAGDVKAPEQPDLPIMPLIGFGLLTGIVLALLTFDFAGVPLAMSASGTGTRALDSLRSALTTKATSGGVFPSFAMVWLFGGTLVVATVIGVVEWSQHARLSAADWLLSVGLCFLPALASVSVFVYVTTLLVSVLSSSLLNAMLALFPAFTGYLLVLLGGSAVALGGPYRHHPTAAVHRSNAGTRLIAAVMIAGGIGGSLMLIVTTIDVVQADIFAKQAPRATAEARDVQIEQQTWAIHPVEASTFVVLGTSYLDRARDTTDPIERNEFLGRSEMNLIEARERDPFDVDHTVALARLHQTWAALAVTPTEQDNHIAQAVAYYTQAIRLSPYTAHLYNQYAQILLDSAMQWKQRKPVQATAAERSASALLARALALDPTFCLTLALRADTQGTWMAIARDAIAALQNLPRCRSSHDPFEHQARTQALRSLAYAGGRASTAHEAAAFEALLAQAAETDSSAELYQALADFYVKQGALEPAIHAAEASMRLIPMDNQMARMEGLTLLESLRKRREAKQQRGR
jgi:hypothetical protein